MTKPVIAYPGRGIRVESVRLVQHTGEIDEYTFRSGMLNIITGVRNSSKTTTLKAIDYCLGDRDSPRDALTIAVAEKYVEISTDLTLNGTPHTLSSFRMATDRVTT
jgi:DNA repair ATPase RecN